MADRKRAELADAVKDICESVQECGFSGLLEAPVMKTFTDLHKLNDTEHLSSLIEGLEGAATRMISGKASPSFPELMVLSQLLSDVEGPAGPPEGSDSPLDTEFKSLAANLRLALISGLHQFARPGSAEAKEGLDMASGMLLLLHDKVAADSLTTLAVEHAMLRLLSRRKSCVVVLRDRTWALAALHKQVAALKDFDPAKDMDGAGEEEEAADEEELFEEEEEEGGEFEVDEEDAAGDEEEDE